MRRIVPLGLGAATATVVVVVGGLLAFGGSDESTDGDGPPAATFTTTPLASYDAGSASVSRGAFCPAVDERQVEAALDGDPVSATSWQNGDAVEIADGVEDIGHEFGCEYVGADGAVARAWVFAPPVDAEAAQRLVRSAGKAPVRGLFGDSWLVCEVVRPVGATWDVTDRAGRWCVGALRAAGPDSGA